MENKLRIFEDKPATRESVPLLIGLTGVSGSGKTFSALRLATGIQRITGGDIFGIDTESSRMKHYADQFTFRHVKFDAPFGSLDYLGAIEHCINKGAKVVIVDSLSHEHEGPGGLLESHQSEVERLSKGDPSKAERVNFLAWAKPKAARRRLINTVLQMNANFIFCFRSKEKIKIVKGGQIEELGFQAIAGEEFLYEQTINILLMPNANGVPCWSAEHRAENQMIKLPLQFKSLFAESKPLDESIGEELAKWAAGKENKQAETNISENTTKKLLAAFADLGISRTMIESRLEKNLDVASDFEIKNLRKVYTEIKEGRTSW